MTNGNLIKTHSIEIYTLIGKENFMKLTWCSIMGLLAKSISGLGELRVKGLNRVPKPPTRINAFMLIPFTAESFQLNKKKFYLATMPERANLK